MLEERIWEVGRHVRKDGKLGNLLLWLHEAEALLNYYETDESWVCEVPAKFLLRQHEVRVKKNKTFFSLYVGVFWQRFRSVPLECLLKVICCDALIFFSMLKSS